MRYRLRTLMLLLVLGPPLLSVAWSSLKAYRLRQSIVLWEDVSGPGAVYIFEGSLCIWRTLPEEPALETPDDHE
jgi:hypothetical protein